MKRAKDAALKNFKGARSVCTCGHTGDVPITTPPTETQHAGIIGHGACTVCPCAKFTWADWTPNLAYALRKARS